jgi:hypothetical protein
MATGILVFMGLTLGDVPKEATYLITTTMEISASNGGTITGGLPIVRSWPEQDVELIEQEAIACKIKVQNLVPGATIAMITTKKLPPGGRAYVKIVQRVTSRIIPLADADEFVSLPSKNNVNRPYLIPTPGIESKDKHIVAKAAELVAGAKTPWEKASRCANWTRQHIKYELGNFTSARTAFDTGKGDCEELAALFIALCRSQGIPARKVSSPGLNDGNSSHSWAEICLAKSDGTEAWLPVDVGLGIFGEMPAPVVALHKGEGYRFGANGPLKHELQYWASGNSSTPEVTFTQTGVPETPGAELELTKYTHSGLLRLPGLAPTPPPKTPKGSNP